MVGLIIAVVIGIIALAASAATARMALPKEIQTAEFIREWHKHSTELWTEQNKNDSEKANELTELRPTVILLEDQLEILKEQIKLKCYWNVPSYWITPLWFNESKYDWD